MSCVTLINVLPPILSPKQKPIPSLALRERAPMLHAATTSPCALLIMVPALSLQHAWPCASQLKLEGRIWSADPQLSGVALRKSKAKAAFGRLDRLDPLFDVCLVISVTL